MRRFITLLIIAIAALTFASSAFARDEEVTFESHGAVLSGTLIWPDGRPKASIVIIHGSPPQERMTDFAHGIAQHGYAVLTYDKRGVGRSGGVYEAKQNSSAANIGLLADDATAAVHELAKRPDLRALPIGLLGFSQAGWIAPLVAANDRDVAFIGLWAGPVCRVSEQFRFQKLTGSGADLLPAQREKFIAAMTADGDVDPVPMLSRLHIPAMWILGAKDEQVPTDLAAQRLDRLIAGGHSEFAYKIFPELGHPAASKDSIDYMLQWLDRTVAASPLNAR